MAMGAAAPACAQPTGLPSMGAASSSDLSPALEQRLGDAIMVQGRRDPTYIDDVDLSQYLTTMGRKLAVHAPGGAPQIQVFGVRDPSINAFALPGGYIGINSGLVVSSESESELAGVLAHEIGHVAQRHIARGFTQQSRTSTMMMATVAASLLAALAGGSADLATGMAAFGQAAAINQQLGFSRDAEREADRAGLEMLSRANYDPAGMARMFGRLMSASRLNEGVGGGSYASTHPLSIERMSDVQNRVRMAPPSSHVDSDDYWFLRARLRLLQARDTQGQRNAVQQLANEAQSLSGSRQAAARYGMAVHALARGNDDETARLIEQIRASVGENPYVARLEIEMHWARKDNQRALQLAEAAYKRWPQRRSLGFAYAQGLQNAGRHQETVAFLRDRQAEWAQDDPRLYQLMAQSAEKLGQPVAARREMARYYVATGALPAAVAQLQQARSMSSDFYEQSQIDVEIRQAKERLAQERELLERFRS
ncbi:M48 family metalloprotease [Orrella sp. JC864]